MSVEKDVSPPNQKQWLWQNTMTKATRTKGLFGLRVTVPEGESPLLQQASMVAGAGAESSHLELQRRWGGCGE